MNKSYRPPNSVSDVAKAGLSLQKRWQRGQSEFASRLSKGEALSVDDLRKVYSFFETTPCANPFEKHEDGGPADAAVSWMMHGGDQGLKWVRRVLRQGGVLKSANIGETQIPEFVDLQLGPYILMGLTELDAPQAADELTKANVSGSCIPVDDGTLVFFATGDDTRVIGDLDSILVNKTEFSVRQEALLASGANVAGMIVVDDSYSKVKSVSKSSGSALVSAESFLVEEFRLEITKGLTLDEVFLLRVKDTSEHYAQIIKVDDELGLVLGWAIISTIEGAQYFDKQGDHVPDDSMLEASADFMIHCRVGGDMHLKTEDGQKVNKGMVVFAWPMTAEIAKAFGIETNITGLMIAYRPSDDEILEKFRNGTYTGFSIGGYRIEDEEVTDGEAS